MITPLSQTDDDDVIASRGPWWDAIIIIYCFAVKFYCDIENPNVAKEEPRYFELTCTQ